ncbi:hypothetical protein A8L34_27050 [Bacillus sp. FJAT-27264]|uniref:hypothetical protein n=1 Tax=Paenibacillus sp. (strain DSM 101736 / FJAT-27264) TaxID=1850362 RepID=UPI0008081180|nr:hypothetical protein [Bacillus sp. FJAT-27264]OBZ16339.1 hypothetical protein A8L34_27050 [Bacillus sp. FJAT-27264]
MAEYAKLVKIKTDNVSDKGFKATLQLPSSKTLPGSYDYINFYVGLGTYECGISCKDQPDWKENGVLKWRAFANGESNTSYGPNKYSDGAIVTISLERNAQNKVEFRVNNSLVKTFDKALTSYTNSARLILAAYQATGATPPLAPWNVKHNQVRAYEMKYKNSSDTWIAFTSGSKVTTEEWPLGVATPDGKVYTLDKTYIGNSDVYASLNK